MAEQFRPPPYRQRNPVTYQKYKREVFYQIYLPTIIGALVLLIFVAGVLIASARGTGDISKWADTALISLILPAMIVNIIFIAASTGMIYLVTRLLAESPFFFKRIQDFFVLVGLRVRNASDASTEPFLRVHSFVASLRALRRR